MGLKDSEVSLYKLKEMKDNKELFTDEDDIILFLDTHKSLSVMKIRYGLEKRADFSKPIHFAF